jgi:hypothetical protein
LNRIVWTLVLFLFSISAFASSYVGMVPGIYLNQNKNNFYLTKISVSEVGVITSLEKVNEMNIRGDEEHLKSSDGNWLSIYPGLIDLHGHPKQNVLPLWGEAHGQFGNRHEWREWSEYQKDVSGNMNPWSSDYYMLSHCAAFRWAELQAMVLGTIYNQGWSFCEEDFSIFNVERGDGYIESEVSLDGKFVMPQAKVSAPTDLIFPKEFTFVWDEVRPIKQRKKISFPESLQVYLDENCFEFSSKLKAISSESDASLISEIKNLGDLSFNDFVKKNRLGDLIKLPSIYKPGVLKFIKENIDECKPEKPHSKFKRFMTRILPLIAGKHSHLKGSERGVVLAHLAEGRKGDPYNKLEIDLLRLVDLDLPGMNLVHANGLGKKDIIDIGKKGIGVVWSPFSNLLLYNETLDIQNLKEANVLISLGSDWTPTGSKSLLEEVKVAKKYLMKKNIFKQVGGDEFLYHTMVTNPAKMIKRLESNKDDGINGIGTLADNAVASFFVTSIKNSNPFSNLVDAKSSDIKLVVAQGKKIYGEKSLMSGASNLEVLPKYFFHDVDRKYFSSLKDKELKEILGSDKVKKLQAKNDCSFSERYFSKPESKSKAVGEAYNNFSVDLNSPEFIQKVLGVMLLSKSKNIGEEKHEDVITYFPSLFSCNDHELSSRLGNFIQINSNEDELSGNLVYREEFRKIAQEKRDLFNQKDPKHLRVSVPFKLARLYSIDYDVELGVYGY